MTELLIPSTILQRLVTVLLCEDIEACAVLMTCSSRRNAGERLLANDVVFPEEHDFAHRSPLEAELRPEFVAAITSRARSTGHGLVFVHSHVGMHAPEFSSLDDLGEKRLAEFLGRRLPSPSHAALVISRGGITARVLGAKNLIRVVEVGAIRRELSTTERNESSSRHAEFDRQIRAFGRLGQNRLANLTVAVVGLGGTGSLVAQQLAHLGVRRFLLVDPDIVEVSNLNRLANATKVDVGRPKTEVAHRYIAATTPDAVVTCLNGDVMRAAVARELTNVDFIFGCTDSHGSRAVIQQVAYQYLVPCIDMGTTIVAKQGVVTHVHGRVQMLAPGLACLHCSSLLDPNEVRRDMQTMHERKADPYIVGEREPAPAVMSINSTASSLAVTMFLNAVIGMPGNARHLHYNAVTGSVRPVAIAPQLNCFICSVHGVVGLGDSSPLMARLD